MAKCGFEEKECTEECRYYNTCTRNLKKRFEYLKLNLDKPLRYNVVTSNRGGYTKMDLGKVDGIDEVNSIMDKITDQLVMEAEKKAFEELIKHGDIKLADEELRFDVAKVIDSLLELEADMTEVAVCNAKTRNDILCKCRGEIPKGLKIIVENYANDNEIYLVRDKKLKMALLEAGMGNIKEEDD